MTDNYTVHAFMSDIFPHPTEGTFYWGLVESFHYRLWVQETSSYSNKLIRAVTCGATFYRIKFQHLYFNNSV